MNRTDSIRQSTVRVNVTDAACHAALCDRSYSTRYAYSTLPGQLTCDYTLRLAEAITERAVANGTCTRDQFTIRAQPGTMTLFFDDRAYPTLCTFTSAACAHLVCQTQAQTSRVNATGGKWQCYSDSAVARAAAEGTYWFAEAGNECRASPPVCRDLTGGLREWDDVLPPFARADAAKHAVSAAPGAQGGCPLILLAAATAAAALLGTVA
jgi:hypothetical protein